MISLPYILTIFFGLSLNGWILIIVMCSLSGAAMFVYIGAKKNGQFENVESIKYRMLFDEDEEWEFND